MEACTMLLLGLRYSDERIAEVRKGIDMVDLRESSFYKLIHEEGVSEGELATARRIILSLGRRKFGPSSLEVESALEGIADPTKLEAILDRLLDASSWEDLLAGGG